MYNKILEILTKRIRPMKIRLCIYNMKACDLKEPNFAIKRGCMKTMYNIIINIGKNEYRQFKRCLK